MPRAHIVNIAKAFRNAIIIQHQVNNGYNYSFLEWLMMGFPVIHNVQQFKEYAYYYDQNDFDQAANLIETVVQHHAQNQEAYAAHAKQLAWRFSIQNPDNAESWKRLILDK